MLPEHGLDGVRGGRRVKVAIAPPLLFGGVPHQVVNDSPIYDQEVVHFRGDGPGLNLIDLADGKSVPVLAVLELAVPGIEPFLVATPF